MAVKLAVTVGRLKWSAAENLLDNLYDFGAEKLYNMSY